MIRKIISGGQTGADQGGLEAARELGLEMGGTAPQRFMTELGTALRLRDVYGLTEGGYDTRVYPKRTRQNVEDSDGTVIFGDFYSPGAKLAHEYCHRALKPLYRVCREDNPIFEKQDFLSWLKKYNIQTLNVAGNRESKNPGIQERVRAFLVQALKEAR